jgi:hypothetical protein
MAVKRKNPAAVALGRKGGKNSRVNLTPEKREALAKKAAAARWSHAKLQDKPLKDAGDKLEPKKSARSKKPK